MCPNMGNYFAFFHCIVRFLWNGANKVTNKKLRLLAGRDLKIHDSKYWLIGQWERDTPGPGVQGSRRTQ